VLKNVTDLEPEATQEVAKEKMDSLVLSYQKLDDYLDMARQGNTDALPKAEVHLQQPHPHQMWHCSMMF
jgi:hypothetical protein